MNHHLVARVALSVFFLFQASATIAIDCNRTHATNPSWTGHARFHLVWQTITVVLLSALGFVLIWRTGPYECQQFYLSTVLAALSPLAFLTASLTRHVFGGTLSDPNGISPVHVKLAGSVRDIDLNLVSVLAAIAWLLMMIWIFHG